MRRPPISAFSASPRLLTAALMVGAACATFTAPANAAPRQRVPAAANAERPAEEPSNDAMMIVVSLKKQRLNVFDRAGNIIESSPISSGTDEFPTPTGIFSIIGKSVDHESNIYEGAPMPFMQRLTWTGTALHAGVLPGYPASHGCIRLPHEFAEKLFEMTKINTRVIVTRDDYVPQFISHAKLFKPAIEPQPAHQPMVQAVTSKVASLDATPLVSIVQPVTNANQLPLTAKAKARFAETARLFDAIKPAEAARNVVWENVKRANRDLEAAKADINSLQNTIDDASAESEKLKKAKAAAEAQLAAVMKKAEKARTPQAIEAFAKAEEAAEARLLDAVNKFEVTQAQLAVLNSGMPKLQTSRQTAEANRRALDDDLKRTNQALKDAVGAHALAKREDVRYMKPVSILVSRKDQRLYVRQGFDPVLEVPVTIQQPDQPLGTHLYTAMSVKGASTLQWSLITVDGGAAEQKRGKRAEAQAQAKALASGAQALDRIEVPAEALDAISDVVKPGSSLIVSDEGNSQYFGNGTDFTVSIR